MSAAPVSKLGLFEVRTRDVDRMATYYEQALGLVLVERSDSACYLTTGPDHHCVVVAEGEPDGRAQLGFELAARSTGRPFDTLFTEDDKGTIAPGLATRSAYSSDAKTLTLTLREGVKFQDGTPFDSDAVKANIKRGQSNPKSVVVGQLAPIVRVDTPGPATVVIRLKMPSGALLGYFTGAAGMMASPKSWTSGDNPTHPVGTGPWAVSSESVPGSDMVYTRFAGYWKPQVQRVDTVHIKFAHRDGRWAIAHRDVVFDWSRVGDATTTYWDLVGLDGSKLLRGKFGATDPLYSQLDVERGSPWGCTIS